jgi:glycerol-3-phosphate dehydrogenase (NAD(P)+)
MSELKVGILGGGSWATALTKIITLREQPVNWWIRHTETVKFIRENKRNPNY